MPNFSIVFITPVGKNKFKHRIIEGPDQESALKTFFVEEITEFYSDDEQGYFYFKDDFFDESNPAGGIVSCE